MGLAALWVLWNRMTGSHLLQDTDTIGILNAIRERGSPLSWFGGDWPLGNHFYRPLPSLFFELDNALYGRSAAGYGWTNALIAATMPALVFWLGRVMQLRAWAAAGAGALIAVWLTGLDQQLLLPEQLRWLFLVVLTIPVWRSGAGWPYKLGWVFFAFLTMLATYGPVSLSFRIIGWLPGRTASVMTLFLIPALAVAFQAKSRLPWILAAFGLGLLALGSYEQAVMIPFLYLALALAARPKLKKAEWQLVAGFAVSVALYLALRVALVPSRVSGYQDQQLRFGPGVWVSQADYLLLPYGAYQSLRSLLEFGLNALVVPDFWTSLGMLVVTVWAWTWLARTQKPRRVLALMAASWLAFLPMSFLKMFEHYHLLPMALRALMVVGMAEVVLAAGAGVAAQGMVPESPSQEEEDHSPNDAQPENA